MYSMYVLATVGTSYSIVFVSSIKWPHCTVSACTGPDGVVCTMREMWVVGEVWVRGEVWFRGYVWLRSEVWVRNMSESRFIQREVTLATCTQVVLNAHWYFVHAHTYAHTHTVTPQHLNTHLNTSQTIHKIADVSVTSYA